MSQPFRAVIVTLVGIGAFAGPAFAQNDPPGRVARLAFTDGAVSFHDDQQSDWSRAAINTPLTSGDAVWTEPGARSEISLAGTRVRLDGGTELDMLALDDTQTRMQLAQGRIDIKTFTLDTNQPYQIVTPRGTITLAQQGDYYVEAGSTQDPTRIGVRSGAATIQDLNGHALAVRAGEVGEISGDAGTPQLRTVTTAPPPMPAYWAARDKTISYDTPQYVNADMTGYEDLNANGTWENDPTYGQVWTPRTVPAGWEPYRTGSWQYVKPWGWTWVDEQPWGFAPYHYGRWANRNNRWSWVPPERQTRPVYAPALVAFIGGVELSISLGQQSRSPVGWFPLAPREAYVPPYTTNRTYYQNVNRSDRVDAQMLDDRWTRAQSPQAVVTVTPANQQRYAMANQRFATVVTADDFVHSRPVARAAIKVAPEKIAAAPVAPVSAPPAPTQSVNAPHAATATPPNAAAPNGKPADPKTAAPKAAQPKPQTQAEIKAQASVPTAKAEVGGMTVLGKPAENDRPKAPGPKVAATTPTAPAAGTAAGRAPPAAPQGHATAPPLQPRTGAAPPKLDEKAPVKPGPNEAKAPMANDVKTPTAPSSATPAPAAASPQRAEPAKPEPAKPATATTTPAKPEPPKPEPPKAEPPKPATATATPAKPEPVKPEAAKPEPAKPAELARPTAPREAQPAHPEPQVAPRPEGRAQPQPEAAKPAEKGAAVTPPAPPHMAEPVTKPPAQVQARPEPPKMTPAEEAKAAEEKAAEEKKNEKK